MAVGLLSWEMLVEHLLEDLQLDRKTINGLSEPHQMLAEYYRIKHGNIGALRSWLDRHWKVASDRVAKSDLHRTNSTFPRFTLPIMTAISRLRSKIMAAVLPGSPMRRWPFRQTRRSISWPV